MKKLLALLLAVLMVVGFCTVAMADEVFELTAENYANGLCDINTYSLAQSRRDNAYNQHLTALARYWTTYYHLLTLTQYE